MEIFSWIKDFGIVAVLAGIATVWLTQRWQQKAEMKLKLRESKEKQYKDLLTNLMGFFEGWEDYEISDKKKRKKQFMWEVYTSAIVFASDEVLKLCYEFIESHSKSNSNKDSDKIYAEIVLAIRKELNKIYGQPDTQLSKEDIKILKVD